MRGAAGERHLSVRLYALDRVAPPVPAPPVVSAFDNKIEIQWPGVVDSGSGTFGYRVYRKLPSEQTWTMKGDFLLRPNFVDLDVGASGTWDYIVQSIDSHFNFSNSAWALGVQRAPAGSNDPRQIGLRPTGAYWGGTGEQIDVMSGNLNLTIPITRAEARTGWGVTFALNFNSQIWRKDGGNTWKYGEDVGYGFGWRLLAGSLTPVYSTWYNIAFYLFTDSSGAEYRLDQNTNAVWTSATEGLYISYDTATQRLWFNDGSFWLMNVESSGAEQDAGTLYPSLMQDSNGNQIKVHYQMGIGWYTLNSSARITLIEAVKRVRLLLDQ